ncbi:MAG TPA: dockerin type I domain-containing protein [Thermoguttaceae bacterium]|nr:dockerin type I domain-containing protein [Thermoguttaceae bacterium]
MTVRNRVGVVSRTLVALVAFVAALATAGAAFGQTWTVTHIPVAGDCGRPVEVEVDSTGLVHGASYTSSSANLWYGQYNGSSWSSEYPSLSSHYSLALDSTGRPYVAFTLYQNGKFYLALSHRTDAGTWETSSFPTSPAENPRFMSLDFDSQDRPHIAYKDTAAQTLRHAYRSGSVWTSETVLSNPAFQFVNQDVRIAMGDGDTPHFLWNDYDVDSIKHTRWTGSSFQTQTIGTGLDGSMVFDSANSLHLCYAKDFNYMTHAVFSGGSWSTGSVIDDWSDDGAIAIDLLDRPHVVYRRIYPGSSLDTLKHAAWNGAGWTTQNIAQWTSTISGPETEAVVIDGSNRMHVLFTDDSRDLYYATCDLGRELAMTPTVDFNAVSSDGVHFTVTDGDTHLFTQQISWANKYNRAVMEFDLSAIPESVIIESATLQLDINLFSNSPTIYPSLQIYGYTGDGVIGTADPTQTAMPIGQSALITALDPITIDLDADFIDSIVRGETSYLGLVAFDPITGNQVGFYSMEESLFGQAPTLALTYALRQYLIPGDATGNDVVDAADAAVLASHWGTAVGNGPADGDFNRDGFVNAADASILAANWGSHGTEAAAVPEPAISVVLLVLAMSLLLRRRHRV